MNHKKLRRGEQYESLQDRYEVCLLMVLMLLRNVCLMTSGRSEDIQTVQGERCVVLMFVDSRGLGEAIIVGS